ncbi:hypothetical protein LY76DRAFT_514079, partial [Colletotrichum caudatum]
FISHAKMYVLADCYGVEGLESLSLRKLHRALKQFELSEEGIGDIVQLMDSLRFLVNRYSACKVEDLWKGPVFQALLDTNSEYAKGLQQEMLGAT